MTSIPATEIRHATVATNGIEMHVASAGERVEGRPPVVFCHGWPELWYSWRHQLPAVAEAGWHAVAPDQRGYGGTSRHPSVDDYDIAHLGDDLLGLLDAMGEEKAVFVGHDWGAPVVWHLAQRAPERVAAVVGMSVPFTPRSSHPPTAIWKRLFGDIFFYILYFQRPEVADAELGADVGRTMRSVLWSISGDAPDGAFKVLPREGSGFLDAVSEPPSLPPWLTAADLEVFVTEFSRTGFTGGLNWYRNFDRNWELTADLATTKVEMPALFVAGERDPVIRMASPEGMREWVTDLRDILILPGAGHWIQQERPNEVNAALLDFLAAL